MSDGDPRREYASGEPAPATGDYEELNVFGTRTGRVHRMLQGELLPSAPRGFKWQLRALAQPDGRP